MRPGRGGEGRRRAVPVEVTHDGAAVGQAALQRDVGAGQTQGRALGHSDSTTSVRPRMPASAIQVAAGQADCRSLRERAGAIEVDDIRWGTCSEGRSAEGARPVLRRGCHGTGLWRRCDFARLTGRLRALEGNFLLSINDEPEVRQIFAGFWMQEVNTTYTIGSGSSAAAELLIIREEPGSG